MNNTLLNYHYQKALNPTSKKPKTMLFIHGLFGDLNNLGVISRAFADEYDILRVDLRNHGNSFHSDEMTLPLMAQDIYAVINHLGLRDLIVIGHSLGGKTAMTFTHHYPQLVKHLVVIDIAPVAYKENRHTQTFAGLFAVKAAKPETRQQAKEVISQQIPEEGVWQFMLKSFDPQAPEYFKFNLSSLERNYPKVMGWEKVSVQQPTLFIKGGNSDYMLREYTQETVEQFPNSKVHVISNASHWVHAEKSDSVIQAIAEFISPTQPLWQQNSFGIV